MSLVTRCPTCATTFKVVRDQLRISDGWVRCGRCSEVFDATKALLDAETGEPVPPQSFVVAPPAVAFDEGGAPDSPPQHTGAEEGVGAAPPAFASTQAFDALQADLNAFGRDSAALPAPAQAPAVREQAWPAPDLLELSLPVPPAPSVSSELATTLPSALPPLPSVPAREAGGTAAAAVPAWRRIQAPPLASSVSGVLADEPWPMRHASAAPPAPAPAASPIEAAVDAQLQKALRRARADALREREVGHEVASSPLASRRPPVAEARPADASPTASVLRQASTDAAADASAAAAAPVADTMLDSTLYAADFMVSRPADLAPRAAKRSHAWALAVLALLAVILLAAQLLRHERDAWAASQPALRPAIEALCAVSDCVVSAPRRIDAVRIDGSSFTPSRQGERYELVFTLRNAAPTAVAMPSIELSLLDGNERPVVRRVFHPADFGAPVQMAPRGEQMARLQLTLQPPPDARAPAVVGYSMLAFYP